MDIASFAGLGLGLFCIVFTIMGSGNLMGYIDFYSVIVTFGGTLATVVFAFPFDSLKEAMKSVKYVFIYKQKDSDDIIKSIIDLANIARKEGLLALEEAAMQLKDEFLQKGIMLIVDGTDPELVRNILETELAFIEDRHKGNQSVFETMGALGPGFGMIGTLIGLINMLANLKDPSSVGPNMAVAIVTTFYGSMIANLFCTPVTNKLKIRSSQEILIKEVMLEGMLSIQAGENPRIIEEKLKAFLSPRIRKNLKDTKEQNEGVE
ncbi:motility protein A [Lutispora sp.]|uniref:motility protein A n=1 Tax=Lutispora sp. TaxID=2828727 RepID=UPI000ED0BE26|nr:motility protein A [Lutispora sp.]MEA4962758.1 motility protein A [Lutispora sp.]HCJ58192.1 motility protein A [Clostridiaceae bacterium]